MTGTTTQSVTLVAATVGTGLMAGLYFAFDISVMPGLGRGDDQTYVTAMRNINDAIDNGLFGLLFLGAFLATGVAATQQQRGGRPDAARWGWAAFALYGLSLAVTAIVNIPLNNQLARAGDRRRRRPLPLRRPLDLREHRPHRRLHRRPGRPGPRTDPARPRLGRTDPVKPPSPARPRATPHPANGARSLSVPRGRAGASLHPPREDEDMDTLTGLLEGPKARGAFLLKSVFNPPWSLRVEDRAPSPSSPWCTAQPGSSPTTPTPS